MTHTLEYLVFIYKILKRNAKYLWWCRKAADQRISKKNGPKKTRSHQFFGTHVEGMFFINLYHIDYMLYNFSLESI